MNLFEKCHIKNTIISTLTKLATPEIVKPPWWEPKHSITSTISISINVINIILNVDARMTSINRHKTMYRCKQKEDPQSKQETYLLNSHGLTQKLRNPVVLVTTLNIFANHIF